MFKKILMGLGGLFVLLIVIGVVAGGGDKKASSATTATSEQAMPVQAMPVTSQELGKAYAANEVAAQSKYGKGPLEITGPIVSIDLDFSDNPVLQLRGDDEFSSVAVNLDKDASEMTANMTKGQKITVTCNTLTEIIGTPQLSDCTL